MARNDQTATAVAEAPTDSAPEGESTQAATEGTATEGDKPKRGKRNTYTMPVTIPNELHAILLDKAKADNKNATQMVREVLAGYVNYTLPVTPERAPRRKFASKEEAVRFRKERNVKAKALLAALDSGEIDESVLAKFLAAQRSNGASEAAGEGSTEGEAVAASA